MLTDLRGGGAEKIPLVLAPALRSSLTVMLLKNRIEHQVPTDGPRVLTFSSARSSLAAAGAPIVARAARAARGQDLLVAGLEWAPTFFAQAIGLLARRPVIATVHTDLRRYGELEPVARGWRSAMRLALRSCAAVVAVSNDALRSVAELGVPSDHLHLIPNPVAPQRSSDAHPRAGHRVLTVASLKTIKGIDTAIAAASRLGGIDFEWAVVGEGPERRRFEDDASAGPITFAGFQPDTTPYYATADIFVLPSRIEGDPLALLEAMSAGLAIVATRCSKAVEEHLAGGVGELVPVDDAGAMAAAIRSLLADPERRARMGAAARERVRAYTPEAIAAQYDELFATVLGA